MIRFALWVLTDLFVFAAVFVAGIVCDRTPIQIFMGAAGAMACAHLLMFMAGEAGRKR